MKQRLDVVRPANIEDRPRILELLRRAGLPTAGVAEWLDQFVVAEMDGTIVGVAGLEVHGSHGLLRSVAVEKAARGREVGRRLTDHVVESARRAGLDDVYLLTTTAASYFARHGFRPVDRRDVPADVRQSVEFREACPATATAMVLPLA